MNKGFRSRLVLSHAPVYFCSCGTLVNFITLSVVFMRGKMLLVYLISHFGIYLYVPQTRSDKTVVSACRGV